jgi:hypothetical protein
MKKLKKWITTEHETQKWTALNGAADDLIQKTDALRDAQARVPAAEEDYKTATTNYENAAKNRLDNIKQRIADNESPAKEVPPKTSQEFGSVTS